MVFYPIFNCQTQICLKKAGKTDQQETFYGRLRSNTYMKRFTSWFLIFSLILQQCSFLFAASLSEENEMLSMLAMREHYERQLQIREQQRYDLEKELEILQNSRSADAGIQSTQTQRINAIKQDLEVIDTSIKTNQTQLLQVRTNLVTAGNRQLGRETYQDEAVSTAIAAVNVTNIQSAVSSAAAIPTQVKAPMPTTGVIAQQNGIVTTIEHWQDGNYYQVNRYADGPSKGSFAPGGKQKLTDAEVQTVGKQLQTQQLDSLRGNVSNSQTQIDSLKQQIKQAKDPAVKADLEQQLSRTEKVQSELKSELKNAEARPVTDFIKSGLSFAAMSVAITGAYNIVQQVIDNGGDLSAVNLGQAFQFVTEGQFWGGVAGSFTGGMIGSALTSFLPGPFRIFGSIAGAAIGHQFGTGNWRDTDWAQIAAQTIGSTIGYVIGALIGSFLGPLAPVAIIAFSILGSWLADKALQWMRDTFTPKVVAYDLGEIQDQELAALENYADSIPDEGLSELEHLSDDGLREELWETYTLYQSLQQMGPTSPSENDVKFWRMEMVRTWTRYSCIRTLLTERASSFMSSGQLAAPAF